MIKEIRQQPEVLQRILDDEWGTVLAAAGALRERGFRSAMLAARGTSDNAALYAKYLLEVLLGVPATLASPSVFTLYGSKMDLRGALVVGISQSGESKDILETLRRSRELGPVPSPSPTMKLRLWPGRPSSTSPSAPAKRRVSRRRRPSPRSYLCSIS
jgi:glucosamine--fructose-6-phosphate aminotransferase (isomerizing)